MYYSCQLAQPSQSVADVIAQRADGCVVHALLIAALASETVYGADPSGGIRRFVFEDSSALVIDGDAVNVVQDAVALFVVH